MRFLQPNLFWLWGALIAVPIILYLFRPRPRTIKTSTLPFFKWLAKEHQESSWLRKLKHLLSLLICVLVIGGGAAALAQLVFAPASGEVKSVIVLVDRSASMAAKDENGRTRLEVALADLDQRVAGLPAGVDIQVIAYDRRWVPLVRSNDRRQVRRALSSLKPRPIAQRPADAAFLAEQLAKLDSPTVIWHATDGDSVKTLIKDDKVEVKHIHVALEEPVNVGITALDVRRHVLERNKLDLFLRLEATGPEKKPIAAKLSISISGNQVAESEIDITPGEPVRLTKEFEAEPSQSAPLIVRLEAEDDVLEFDNIAVAKLPQAKPVRVAWISPDPDPFTLTALQTLNAPGKNSVQQVEVFHGKPADWPVKGEFDLVLLDGWVPEKWPEDVDVMMIAPPKSVGPLQLRSIGEGLPIDRVRAPGADHPVLYAVASGRVAVTQTAVIQTSGPLSPLWLSEGKNISRNVRGPILLAGEYNGRRAVIWNFRPALSEALPFSLSFPILVGNSIYWATQKKFDEISGANSPTGEILSLEGGAQKITWRIPAQEDPIEIESGMPTYELDRVGFWETESGKSGSASLLSAAETAVPVRPEDSETAAIDEVSLWSRLFRGDLVPLLLIALLLLLLVDWWLYHRHSVG